MRIVAIGINGSTLYYSQCGRYLRPPRGFSPFELLFGRQQRGVLDLIKEIWDEGPSTSKKEIQYVIVPRAKLRQMSRENELRQFASACFTSHLQLKIACEVARALGGGTRVGRAHLSPQPPSTMERGTDVSASNVSNCGR